MSSETPNGGDKKPAIPPPAKKDPALNIGLRGDRLYETNQLHKWFAIASLFLFVFTVWMIVDDYNREWRRYQRAYNRLTVEQTDLDMQAAAGLIDAEAAQQILTDMQAAQAQIDQNAAAVADLEAQLDELNDEFYAVNQRYLFSRAQYDVERYDYEEAIANNGDDVAELEALVEFRQDEIAENLVLVEQLEI